MAFPGEIIHGRTDECRECGVEIAVFFGRTVRRPIRALGPTMREFDDGEGVLRGENSSEMGAETEFRAEVAEIIHRTQRLPLA